MRQIVALVLLLAAVVCSPASLLAEQWVQVRSSHFTVLSNAGEKQARQVANEFERMRGAVQALFPTAPADPAEPVVVFAVNSRDAFASLTPAGYLGQGKMERSGFFWRTPEKNYILVRLDMRGEHPYAAAYHEYTHLALRTGAAWMPVWLSEGLAEFFANTEFRGNVVVLGQASVSDLLYLRQTPKIPLPALLKVDRSSPYYGDNQKGALFYAESWALVHMLLTCDRQRGSHRLSDYRALVERHVDPVTAAQQAFGNLNDLAMALDSYVVGLEQQQETDAASASIADPQQVEQALQNRLRQGGGIGFIFAGAIPPPDAQAYTIRVLTAAEAGAARAEVMAAGGRATEARSLAGAVLAENLNNVQAQETMGLLALAAGRTEEARAWCRNAAALDPNDYLARYLLARFSMEQAEESEPAGPQNAKMHAATNQEAKAIEAGLVAAIRLNPSFAPAYNRLAAFYAERRENLDEAHILNLEAIQLDPGNLEYRLNAAYLMMVMDRGSDALAVLRDALDLAETPEETHMVQGWIDRIGKFEASRKGPATDPNKPGLAASLDAEAPAAQVPAGAQSPAVPTPH